MTATIVRPVERGTYSVRQAAARLGIGKDLAYELIRSEAFPFDGTIRAHRFGRTIRIPIADVDRYLDGQPANAP